MLSKLVLILLFSGKKQNLTQMQLAEALGVSNRAVSKWETGGKCLPDAALWVPLSEYLEVSIEELYFGGEVLWEKRKKSCYGGTENVTKKIREMKKKT